MALLSSIQLTKDPSRVGQRLTISGLNIYDLKRDIRVFFGRNIPKITTTGISMTYHIFSIVVRGVFFGTTSISFEEFFIVEVKKVFEWLYEAFKRSSYKEVINLLSQNPRIIALEKPMEEVPAEVSNKLNSLGVELKDYQKEFLYYYWNATHKVGLNGFIMAFEQGLGKTFTAISAVYALDLFPCIITAPKSTLLSWKNSIEKLLPTKFLTEDVLSVGRNKFIICNYEALEKIPEYLTSVPKCLVVDEIQNFRYMNTARVQNVIGLQNTYHIENVMALSGTPIKALASEFVPVMTLIDPMFRNSSMAQSIFKRLYSTGKYDNIASAVLQERLKLYMIRKEADKELDLPDMKKYDVTLEINNIKPYTLTVVMRNIQDYVATELEKRPKDEVAKLYMQLEKLLSNLPRSEQFRDEYLNYYLSMVKKLEKMDVRNPEYKELMESVRNFEKEIKDFNSELGKVLGQTRRNITSYKFILLGRAIGEYFTRGKIRLLCEVVNENLKSITNIITNAHKKTLIFSTFKEPLMLLSQKLKDAGIKNLYVDSASSYNMKFDSFANDPDTRVILGSIQAIGTGTDGLQKCCDTIIFLNRPFRGTDLQQAEARIHRQGQDSTCHIYYINVDPSNPNVLSHEQKILQWSNEMRKIAGL